MAMQISCSGVMAASYPAIILRLPIYVAAYAVNGVGVKQASLPDTSRSVNVTMPAILVLAKGGCGEPGVTGRDLAA